MVNSRDLGSEFTGSVTEEQSFAGEVWQDVKCNVERRRDMIRHNFLRLTDLSNRRTRNTLKQYKYFLGRFGKPRLREAKIQAIDYLILLIVGACLGSLTKVSDATFDFGAYTYTIVVVSLLCKIAALRSFSLDKLQYWKESASGISSLAHFASKDTIDIFNTLIKPVVCLPMFYFLSNPRSSFAYNYVVLLCLVYCVTVLHPTSCRFDSHRDSAKCKQFCENFGGLLLSKMVFGSICYRKFRTILWCVAPNPLWCTPQVWR